MADQDNQIWQQHLGQCRVLGENKMVERHGKCIGIKLFQWGNHLWELWFCPAGEVIKEHVHQHCDIRMKILGGRMQGRIGHNSGPVGWNDFGRVFDIPAGVVHNAVILDPFCMFLSMEKWDSREPTSAAEDFVTNEC